MQPRTPWCVGFALWGSFKPFPTSGLASTKTSFLFSTNTFAGESLKSIVPYFSFYLMNNQKLKKDTPQRSRSRKNKWHRKTLACKISFYYKTPLTSSSTTIERNETHTNKSSGYNLLVIQRVLTTVPSWPHQRTRV